ncbi:MULTISPECIES: SPL family radical SAM protein [Desulfococcus]|uniref:DNA repair photolyase-like protein n=1 Tax=Desulfococcus multivorans DSM 2059 TaxID=1121405 RepID=S7TR43_DESML|nr:deoxyribodipyrimidine photo-lyase [Desulfococcus multivorans]AOY58958.1 DNA repair photolyase-like protein [Desulfococcus multivorans]AQV01226.1 DNA photolyase [Desulfococcus multivorans]EPR39135.1 DNA repair photolyase-like protein [Desulfococcus multivorans DSM 2059]SJZ54111.1 spore photoproduct lyase [Desulfococcus multivorans DSM 2059]
MPITQIYIDQEVADHPLVAAIRSRRPVPAVVVSGAREVFEAVSADDDPVQKGKEVLFLTRNRGPFIRKCPGTRHYRCCDYMILHVGTFCTMDCAYCILQSYFHPPVLQYFVNHDDMHRELDRHFEQKTFRRIGTGEFTDSMIWEYWTDLSRVLVPRFARQTHSVLELKTKTTAVDALKHLDHRRKTIAAWSVNTETVIRQNERGTAALTARLRAAADCASWGYPVAFHFDPMVVYDGCEDAYEKVVEQIFQHVSPENIVWISIGSFRFMPALKPTIQQRFPDSTLVYGEFVPGIDEKMRYFKPLRIRLYRRIYDALRRIAPEVTVYFCMEDDEVWQKSFGFTPAEKGGLPWMLDESAIQHCNLTT